MNHEIVPRQAVQDQILVQETTVPLERLNAVDRQARGEFVGQDQVVADRRTDIDKAAIRRQASNQVDKDFFFFRFVNVASFIARALLIEELILINANAVVEGVDGASHGVADVTLHCASVTSIEGV